MKKLLPLALAAACFSPAAFAADISTLNLLSQTEFRDLSEDLGAALSYKSVQPAEPLGVTGFDVGLEVTATDISKSSSALSHASGGSTPVSTLYVPKLHVAKGLPFGIDVAASVAVVPTTNIRVVGAELRYALMEGGVALPAVAIRGAISSLSGVDQLSFSTKSLDISISKGFAMITPYAGVGQVWVDSKANVGTLSEETFSQGKFFVGANLNFGLMNFALEADKTGGTQSYTAKLGFRF
ncbi:MAG TPA: hypothetical protein VIU93_05265 [Gallionellaceae bacterium]